MNNNVPSEFTSNTVGIKSNLWEATHSLLPISQKITLESSEDIDTISVVFPNYLTANIFPLWNSAST